MIHPDDGNLAALRDHEIRMARAERRQDLVDEQAQLLLQTEFYPFSIDNLAEAMNEYLETRIDALSSNMADSKFTAIGIELTNHVIAYWMQKAADKAELLVD